MSKHSFHDPLFCPLEFGMIGENTVKSQRPRSVHDTKGRQEQDEAAKFMAQTGNSIVMFLSFDFVII